MRRFLVKVRAAAIEEEQDNKKRTAKSRAKSKGKAQSGNRKAQGRNDMGLRNSKGPLIKLKPLTNPCILCRNVRAPFLQHTVLGCLVDGSSKEGFRPRPQEDPRSRSVQWVPKVPLIT